MSPYDHTAHDQEISQPRPTTFDLTNTHGRIAALPHDTVRSSPFYYCVAAVVAEVQAKRNDSQHQRLVKH